MLLALSGCQKAGVDVAAPGEGLSDEEAALRTLIVFFEHLRAGDYDAAADLYGGSYETMIAHNPEVDPSDRAALLEAACTINGAVCLEVASAQPVHLADSMEGDFAFTVEFRNGDGSIFVLGPCCGEVSPERMLEFTFHVHKAAEYLFQVMDPPVYQP